MRASRIVSGVVVVVESGGRHAVVVERKSTQRGSRSYVLLSCSTSLVPKFAKTFAQELQHLRRRKSMYQTRCGASSLRGGAEGEPVGAVIFDENCTGNDDNQLRRASPPISRLSATVIVTWQGKKLFLQLRDLNVPVGNDGGI